MAKQHGDDNTPNVNQSRAGQPGHQAGPTTPAQPQKGDKPSADPDLTKQERPQTAGEATRDANRIGDADPGRASNKR